MCGSMVDIQSPTAEIRRGKKIKRKTDRKKPQGKNITSASAMQGGHNEEQYFFGAWDTACEPCGCSEPR